jgi:YbgC/YbaW family acyl-CoA thioester hydrolase
MRTMTNYVVPHDDIAESRDFRKTSGMSDAHPCLETREEVMFFDTDCGGVVHNLAYLRMIETCRTRLAALMGMDFRSMSETQVFPVVTRTEIDYKRPARLGDWITIRGRLDELSAPVSGVPSKCSAKATACCSSPPASLSPSSPCRRANP